VINKMCNDDDDEDVGKGGDPLKPSDGRIRSEEGEGILKATGYAIPTLAEI
jgi:hypothetical protein